MTIRTMADRVRSRQTTALVGAAAIVLAGLGWGLIIGEARIGVALGAAIVMVLPWRPTGAPNPVRGSHAAGWRLIGLAIALIGGGDALGELLGRSLAWRIIGPAAVALPILVVGLRWALARHGRVHRTSLDALLIGVGAALLGWQWVWQPYMGEDATAAWGVIVLCTAVGSMGSLMVFSRTGGHLGIERILLIAAGTAYVIAALLVEDAAMIMRSWSAVIDGVGQALAASAVLLGQRRSATATGGPLDVVAAVRWPPAALAIGALLSSIWLLQWRGQSGGDLVKVLQVTLVIVLAGRVAQAGHDWRAAWRRLERSARVDEVTGLRNRAWLSDTLPARLGDAEIAAAIMLDVDRFKLVNDALGHHVGDRLLAVVGERLRHLTSSHDVVRMGGDEFLVLVDSCDQTDPVALAERVRRGLAEPIQFQSHGLRPTVSVGVAFATPTISAADLLHDADSALYRAKQTGRDRVVVFDAAMRDAATRRLEIEGALRAAIERDELTWVYQPIVDARTGEAVQLEVLLHWDHPSATPLGPSTFSGLAEVEGLIGPVRWILDAACQALVDVDHAPGWQGTAVSINISTARLRHLDFVDDVRSALQRVGADPRRLVLEVAESALLDPAGPEVAALRRLVDMDVGIAVDGFGEGLSALGYLPSMDLDQLKLDPGFTGRLGTSQRRSLVGAIIDMAHDLDIRVVAEGVQTETQRAQLIAMGCDLLQGSVIGPPTSLAVLLATHPQVSALQLPPNLRSGLAT